MSSTLSKYCTASPNIGHMSGCTHGLQVTPAAAMFYQQGGWRWRWTGDGPALFPRPAWSPAVVASGAPCPRKQHCAMSPPSAYSRDKEILHTSLHCLQSFRLDIFWFVSSVQSFLVTIAIHTVNTVRICFYDIYIKLCAIILSPQ